MKITNVSQSLKVFPHQVFGISVPQEVLALISEHSIVPTPEREKKIMEGLDDVSTQLYDSCGYKPYDSIDLEVKLNSLLFSIYEASQDAPISPIKRYKHVEKLKKIADDMDKDEFELSVDQVSAITEFLSDDEKWSKFQMPASFNDSKDIERYISFSSELLRQYGQVMEKLIELFVDSEG